MTRPPCPPLETLERCFQGVVPSVVATCAPDGWPNVTYVSQVDYVDPRHVALSCQFFNKTRRNVASNPYAMVEVHDPVTLALYALELRFDHGETEGPLFDRMRVRIDVIAAHTGMTGVFRLLSADVYEVLSVHEVTGFLGELSPEERARLAPEPTPPGRSELHALQRVARTIEGAVDARAVVSGLLDALAGGCGLDHAMVLMADGAGESLEVVGASGCAARWTGARVPVGEGLLGLVASERRIVRTSSFESELRYGEAIRRTAARQGAGSGSAAPLVGVSEAQSCVALPLIARDRLVGVLAVESPSPACFETWHEAFLSVVASHAASCLDNLRPREAAGSVPANEPAAHHVRFYAGDDCVFLDGEYLVRNLPGRILWRLLDAHRREGRSAFLNRELRLDPTLGLPAGKDNLESRLILLRRRLDERCPDVMRIVPSGRGRFELVVHGALRLESLAS